MFGAKVIITLENTKKIMFYSHRGHEDANWLALKREQRNVTQKTRKSQKGES